MNDNNWVGDDPDKRPGGEMPPGMPKEPKGHRSGPFGSGIFFFPPAIEIPFQIFVVSLFVWLGLR